MRTFAGCSLLQQLSSKKQRDVHATQRSKASVPEKEICDDTGNLLTPAPANSQCAILLTLICTVHLKHSSVRSHRVVFAELGVELSFDIEGCEISRSQLDLSIAMIRELRFAQPERDSLEAVTFCLMPRAVTPAS